MISDIFKKYGIEDFAFILSDTVGVGNGRLRCALPQGLNVIFFLMPYYVGGTAPELAFFAAVPDYHIFADTVFSAIDDYFEKKYPGIYHKGFADHSPFHEVEGASLAGLGMIGENSLLITEKYSSFVCIGEYVCALGDGELEDEGIKRGDGKMTFCEKCHKCSSVCPAGCAGGKEREFCISALTQKKGELSDSEKELIKKSSYVWGCDGCQTVCPHTVSAHEKGTVYTKIGFFRDGAIRKLSELEKLSDDEYKKYPFSWRKREIMMRNIMLTGKGKKRNEDI